VGKNRRHPIGAERYPINASLHEPWVNERGALIFGQPMRSSRLPFYHLAGQQPPKELGLFPIWRKLLDRYSDGDYRIPYGTKGEAPTALLPPRLRALLPVALAVRGLRKETRSSKLAVYVKKDLPLVLVGRSGLLATDDPKSLSTGAAFALAEACRAEDGIGEFAHFGQVAVFIPERGAVIWGRSWHARDLVAMRNGTPLTSEVQQASQRDPFATQVVYAWGRNAVKKEARRLLTRVHQIRAVQQAIVEQEDIQDVPAQQR